MPDVSEIIERLRAKACSPDEYRHWNYVEAVTLEQAEAAVLAAVDARTAEIVEWLRAGESQTAPLSWNLWQVSAAVARRFPNGGTNDGT